MSETLRCPKCGHEIDRENPVCAGCGAKLKVKPLKLPEKRIVKVPKKIVDENGARLSEGYCPQCGGKLEAGQKFCPECGTPVAGRKAGPPPVRAAGRTADARKYDEAVRMGQEIEGQAVGWANFSGCLIDPVFGGLPLMIACFFWHELWWFLGIALVFGIAAMCCRAVVRGRLADHDVEGAKSALGPAKTCFWIAAAALGAGLLDVVIRLMALANK